MGEADRPGVFDHRDRAGRGSRAAPRAGHRRTAWRQANRQRPGPACVNGLTARLRGPDRDEGVQGHGRRLPGAPAAWRAPTACPRGARHPDPGRQPPRAPPPDRGAVSPHVRLRVRLARPRVHPRHRRRAHGTSGSVRGAPGHRRPYRGEPVTHTLSYSRRVYCAPRRHEALERSLRWLTGMGDAASLHPHSPSHRTRGYRARQADAHRRRPLECRRS